MAMPWIIFERDRRIFEREFAEFHIQTIEPMMPFRYLLSGGVSMRQLMPAWTYSFWRYMERFFRPCMSSSAMFAKIVLVRK